MEDGYDVAGWFGESVKRQSRFDEEGVCCCWCLRVHWWGGGGTDGSDGGLLNCAGLLKGGGWELPACLPACLGGKGLPPRFVNCAAAAAAGLHPFDRALEMRALPWGFCPSGGLLACVRRQGTRSRPLQQRMRACSAIHIFTRT